MVSRFFIILSTVFFLNFFIQPSFATILISEILADPAAGAAGDANADGSASSSEDEFIEFYNSSDITLNISGWILSDSVRERHIFSDGTIVLPQEYLVVFGGGAPTISPPFQTASTGSLGLNNSGDTINLHDRDGFLIQSVSYGVEGGNDQSLVASAQGWILHTSLKNSNGSLFSPGFGVADSDPVSAPEPFLLSCVALGFVPLMKQKLF